MVERRNAGWPPNPEKVASPVRFRIPPQKHEGTCNALQAGGLHRVNGCVRTKKHSET